MHGQTWPRLLHTVCGVRHAVDVLILPCNSVATTEHRIREAKEDAEAAAKQTSAKDKNKKADDAATGGEDKGEETKQDGATGPDAANGDF